MNLSNHIISTIPLAAVSYAITSSWENFCGVVIGGILVDIDHFLEFWHDHGFNLNIRKFFRTCNNGIQTRHYILLHSYELVLFLVLISYKSPLMFFLQGMALGLIFHIFWDYINTVRRFNYKWFSFALFFLSARIIFFFHRGKIDRIFRHSIEDKNQ